MTRVMSRDGSRILDGAESARQRLGDALRIRRGTYPWLRDYGSRLDDLIDLNMDGDFETRVYAAVADTVAHAPNGLGDIALREVRLHRDPDGGDLAEVEVFADWIAPDGSGGEFGLRQALGAPRPPASTLYTATPVGLHTIDPATGAAARVGSALDYGLGAPVMPTALAWDGRILWMTVRLPGRLYAVDRATGVAERIPGPDNFGIGESRPEAMAWASWRLLMLGDDTDALWALDRSSAEAARVHAIDRFGVGEHQPDGAAWDGWRLWMVGGINDALHRLDVDTGQAIRAGEAYRFGQDLDGGGELAWAPHRLLMMRGGAMLYELDRVSGEAAPLVAIAGLDGTAGGLVWAPEADE